MKIAVGINTFKPEIDFNDREKMCVKTLYKLKDKFRDVVELFNVTFIDEQFKLGMFNNAHCLKQQPTNITNKKIPFVNEIFDYLSETGAEFFLFINNDILISDRYIKAVLNNLNYDCFPASKLHFTKINSLEDFSDSVPESLSVHGFDGFVIRSSWWKQNKDKFKPMLLSRAYWDTYFYSKCHLYGKTLTLNKPPAVIFHLEHKSSSMDEEAGNTFNEKNFFEDKDNIPQRWFPYVQNVLLKRATYNNILWYVPQVEEERLEKQYYTI
jgi:hypothetical protein